MINGDRLSVPYRLLPYGSRAGTVPTIATATVPPPVRSRGALGSNTPITPAGYRVGLGRLFPVGPIGPRHIRDYQYVGG